MISKNKIAKKTRAKKALKTKAAFHKINAQLELQRLKSFLSEKAVDFVLPLTGLVQEKLTTLQQKLNKI